MIEYDVSSVRAAAARFGSMPHTELLERFLPELGLPEVLNGLSSRTAQEFTSVVFNMEQTTRLDMILAYLTRHPTLRDADVILANELDCGMARSGNEDSARVIAEALSMNYAFGTEFVTVSAGENGNKQGLHGNCVFSKYPIKSAWVIRLPILYEWFYKPGDSRLGVRNAVLVKVKIDGRDVALCSAHLENRTTPAGRNVQLMYLLEQIDRLVGNIPTLIGGDMNTNTADGDAPDGFDALLADPAEEERRLGEIARWEPLMQTAVEGGYDYTECNIYNKYTRRRPKPEGGFLKLNLDWFFSRGLSCGFADRVDTVFDSSALRGGEKFSCFDGREISDHDAVITRCVLKDTL